MNGYAFVDLTGINPVETDAQNLDAKHIETITYAAKEGLIVVARGLTACGGVFIENVRISSGAVVGFIPALNKTIAIEAGKITFATPS